MFSRVLLATWFVVCLAAAAAAQTAVQNPTKVLFTKSADHDGVLPDGSPALTSYQLDTVTQTNGALFFSHNIGKPNADAAGTITYTNIPEWQTLALGAYYFATVSALGPGGIGKSSPSDPFYAVGAPRAPGKPVVSK